MFLKNSLRVSEKTKFSSIISLISIEVIAEDLFLDGDVFFSPVFKKEIYSFC